jgi:hypothetical protein
MARQDSDLELSRIGGRFFFNTRGGSYKAGGNPNLMKSDGVTGVGLVSGFDAAARVGSKGIGQSLETPAKFTWTVTDIKNV